MNWLAPVLATLVAAGCLQPAEVGQEGPPEVQVAPPTLQPSATEPDATSNASVPADDALFTLTRQGVSLNGTSWSGNRSVDLSIELAGPTTCTLVTVAVVLAPTRVGPTVMRLESVSGATVLFVAGGSQPDHVHVEGAMDTRSDYTGSGDASRYTMTSTGNGISGAFRIMIGALDLVHGNDTEGGFRLDLECNGALTVKSASIGTKPLLFTSTSLSGGAGAHVEGQLHASVADRFGGEVGKATLAIAPVNSAGIVSYSDATGPSSWQLVPGRAPLFDDLEGAFELVFAAGGAAALYGYAGLILEGTEDLLTA